MYTGRFLFDKRWGYGKITNERGIIYEGYFKSDLMHGQGRYDILYFMSYCCIIFLISII